MRISEWSSDVCSSDLMEPEPEPAAAPGPSGSQIQHLVERIESFQSSRATHPSAIEPRALASPELGTTADRGEEIGRAHAELQSLMRISYAVFCLKKKKKDNKKHHPHKTNLKCNNIN